MSTQPITTLQYLLDKYGLSMTAADVAEFWGLSIGRLYSVVSDRSFPVPSTGEGKKRRWDARDVARVWDERRERARLKWENEQRKIGGDRRINA